MDANILSLKNPRGFRLFVFEKKEKINSENIFLCFDE